MRIFLIIGGVILLAILLFFTLPSFKKTAFNWMVNLLVSNQVPQIHPAEVSLENDIILDIREKSEYQMGHLPGAIWVGFDEFDKDRIPDSSSQQRTIVYCSIGVRSEVVGQVLLDEGYQDVLNLKGGIFQWNHEAMPMVDSSGVPTANVHPYSAFWGIWR